jgi:hypothetical protein
MKKGVVSSWKAFQNGSLAMPQAVPYGDGLAWTEVLR